MTVKTKRLTRIKKKNLVPYAVVIAAYAAVEALGALGKTSSSSGACSSRSVPTWSWRFR